MTSLRTCHRCVCVVHCLIMVTFSINTCTLSRQFMDYQHIAIRIRVRESANLEGRLVTMCVDSDVFGRTRRNSRVKTASIWTSTNQVCPACPRVSNQSPRVPWRTRTHLLIMHLFWLPHFSTEIMEIVQEPMWYSCSIPSPSVTSNRLRASLEMRFSDLSQYRPKFA